MSLPADYHMHTRWCRHAVGEPLAYAERARALGLREIGFSDHSPMWRDDFDDWRMRLDELEVYVEAVRQARLRVPELEIKLGLEVDYLPGREDWVRELASRHPWDYFIGSVHYLSDAWDLDNPNKLERWREREPGQVWSEYFDRLTQAAESGLFEVIGHVDLCKKFGFYPKEDWWPWVERFLDRAAATGVAIELNTAGLRKPCREIYPSRRILEGAKARGIAITFGSDAHAPQEVGADFGVAVELARGVGYRESVRFTGRRRERAEL